MAASIAQIWGDAVLQPAVLKPRNARSPAVDYGSPNLETDLVLRGSIGSGETCGVSVKCFADMVLFRQPSEKSVGHQQTIETGKASQLGPKRSLGCRSEIEAGEDKRMEALRESQGRGEPSGLLLGHPWKDDRLREGTSIVRWVDCLE